MKFFTAMAAAILSSAIISPAQEKGMSAEEIANTIILDDAKVRNLGIKVVETNEADFETTVFSIGRIEEIPRQHSVLSSRIAGRVVEINAVEGDTVSKGDVLVKVESRQPGSPPPVIELTSPQDGLVMLSHIRIGQPVEPANELMDISDLSTVWAVAQVPEKIVSQLKTGTQAHIRIPALGGTNFDGQLIRFDTQASRQGGTIGAIFQIPNPELKLRPGMRAEFSIVTSKRQNVMSVPRKAIQGDVAKREVFIKHFELENTYVRTPVVVGEMNDQYAEIINGLFPGDLVVTDGSYSLGFVGAGSGMSLKEALDAAHGHEHNEDGTIVTEEQKAARAGSDGHDHAEGSASSSQLIFMRIAVGILLVLLVASGIKSSKDAKTIAQLSKTKN
ncbi:efflux RND transporter periplasmic adaptor subunit [Persicirhabdus sediminis]|uniref:Efflux RND transporter periplasmic adaptor subunit n=1 Tax=Persicirhabdus sediminis TaxID=454144 RepID=A0A8J7MKJ9_9BACT|nr:efflux RND transporter periplasmic adaptor subunit [Persicirhabdus sediminis]MBK1792733.1 efflux RND transporter periplasmic adaptor subunit [Persicirhabdus sediminis]